MSLRKSFARRAHAGRGLCALLLAMGALTVAGHARALTTTPILDNDQFSIIRATLAPGEKQAKLHPPPGKGQIVTLVTPAEIEVNLDDGTPRTEKGHMEPGKVWWLSKTTLHQFANTGTKPYDLIVVTLK